MRAILTFHGVDDTRSVLSIHPRELVSLIHAIRASGHAILPLRDLLEPGRSVGKCVAFTFDDGASSVAETGAPILDDLGVHATVFLPTGAVGSNNAWKSRLACPPRFPLMGWHQVERLFAAGHAIEAHSVTHPDLRTLDDDQLDRELDAPIDEIGGRLGVRPSILAYPYGFHDDRVVDRVQGRYRHAVTTRFRALSGHDHPLRLPRLDASYLRSPRIQRSFGDGPLFRTFVGGHGLLRRLRGQP